MCSAAFYAEKETHQVWLVQLEVALEALVAWQWGLKLQVGVGVEVEELQPVPLQPGREQLWQQQLRKQK